MSNQKVKISTKRSIERIIITVFCAVIILGVICDLLLLYKPSKNALGALGTVCMDVLCIAVIFILVLSLAYVRGAISKTTKLFLCLMIGTMWGLFLDFLTWSFDGRLEYGDWTYVFTVGSLCMGSILGCIFVLYLSSYLDEIYGLKSSVIRARVCAVLNLLAFVITLTLALTGSAFTFTDGHYVPGALYDYVTAIPILTLVYMTGYSIRNVKIIGTSNMLAVVGYIVLMITGALVEAEYGIGATYVGIALADLLIFLMLQNKFIDRVREQSELLAKRVDEEKKNVEKWIKKSNTDELTGFYNRHAYEDEIAALSESKNLDSFVYVSIDVNSLKTVNDSLGHEAGDELLMGACECMKQCYGAYGKLFRTGGDEFAALIFADDSQLEEIKKDIDDVTENWNGKLIDDLAISCGYVTKKEVPNMSIHQMAVLADKRMYENKTKYYREKGIDRRGQRDAHVALCALYTKILKINVSNDTYQIINMNADEKSLEKGFSDKISIWLRDFGVTGQVYSEDLEEYLQKANIEYISNHFKNTQDSLTIFYRRKYGTEYKKVMMEIIPANDYMDDSQTLFLYVKDI